MKTITYIFWRLYRYFKKIRQEPYYRSLFIFSFPYSFLIMGHTILFLNSYNVEEWIKIMITCMEVFILPLPLKYIFPKKKIENLEYIAIAPNIFDAHSPKERVEIASANKVWKIVEKLIENI